jgi:hypothetical protein
MMDAGVEWKKTALPLYRSISTKKIDRIKKHRRQPPDFEQFPKFGVRASFFSDSGSEHIFGMRAGGDPDQLTPT